MQLIERLTMLKLAVTDMPMAKEFYAEKLGLEVVSDYRQDDENWWVSLILPEGGITITLSTNPENMQPGAAVLYFSTSDVTAAHSDLAAKRVDVQEIKDDLYGPGSGVKWFSFDDPAGNKLFIAQA